MALSLLLLALCTTDAEPQQFVTQRASLDTDGREGTGSSLNPSLSDDGRHLAFQSTSSLTPLASGTTDVYVRDRTSGTTTLISIGTGGVQANALSRDADVSADGRFVVFSSAASNLIAGDTNGVDDVFLADRDPDGNSIFDEGNTVVIRVSEAPGPVQGNAPSSSPRISADGDWVCFSTLASNLFPNDLNAASDVLVWERATGNLTLVSAGTAGASGNGPSGLAAISGSGRYLAFESLATDLVALDTNSLRDIFLRDRDPDANGIFDEGNASTQLISINAGGAQANASSHSPSISDDGAVIAFESEATNLAAGTGGIQQVFVRLPASNQTALASRSFLGQPGNGASSAPSIAGDGSCVAFESRADNLVFGDTNTWDDIFRVDLIVPAIERLSVSVSGAQSSLYSQSPAIDADGSEVAFQSLADDLVAHDTNGSFDVFVRATGSWSPQLLADPLFRGHTSIVRVCNSTPGETVYLAYSVLGTGAGPCPPALGGLCLDVLNPTLFGSQVITFDGVADFSVPIPAGAPLVPIWFQVAVPRGPGGSVSVKSNVVVETIQP